MPKKSDFEQKIYDDFFSSQMYNTAKRAGNVIESAGNVIGDIVNKAVSEGLDEVERRVDGLKEKAEEAAEKTRTAARQTPQKTPPKEETVTQEKTAPAAPQVPMQEIRLKSNVPFYATGAAWMLYALLPVPMYRIADYLIAAGVSVLVFALSKKIFKGKKIMVPVEEPKKEEKAPEKPAESTGNPEVDRIIENGETYLRQLADADVRIENEDISASIRRMETACRSIFAYISENPGKAGSIRKFMNYYLPTTIKLLNTYDRLSRQGVQGENISSTMFDIQAMMQTIALAFEKQLDNLFANEALDVSADISVMETMLQQEGFIDDENDIHLG